jgi:hypothetical protein
MMPENYLPSRPVDPSTYLNPAMNPAVGGGASVQGPVNQAASLTPEQLQQLQAQQLQMQQAQMQQQAPLQQAQVQQWQAQQGGGAPVAQTPTPEQLHAMQNAEAFTQQRFMRATQTPLTPEQQKARQEQADIINNATLGTFAAAIGVGSAWQETVMPPPSDLKVAHVSEVAKTKYEVMLEPVQNGPVGKATRLFGGGGSEPALRVKHLTPENKPGVSINYNRNGQLQSVVQELDTSGFKAHYILDAADGKWTLSHVTHPRGFAKRDLRYSIEQLSEAINPNSLPPPNRSWWPLGRRASATPIMERLDELTKLGLNKTSIETLLKEKIHLPDLEEVVKNAGMPHNIDVAEVFQKVVTKGGLFAALGALALGGGTWAFQHFTKKSPAQERLEAEIASNQARLAQPGQPPPQPAQAMNPAMYGQNGMPPGMPGMYPQW